MTANPARRNGASAVALARSDPIDGGYSVGLVEGDCQRNTISQNWYDGPASGSVRCSARTASARRRHGLRVPLHRSGDGHEDEARLHSL